MQRYSRFAGVLATTAMLLSSSSAIGAGEVSQASGHPLQPNGVESINYLTNSNGTTSIPLSSYGLSITDDPSADVLLRGNTIADHAVGLTDLLGRTIDVLC
jgi:hypothetical protein